MQLETDKVQVNKSQEELFQFLLKVDNFEKIMPSSIQKFETTGDESFLFQLKGMPEIKLLIKEKQAYDKITLGAKSEKLPFSLIALIEEDGQAKNKSYVQLQFEGNFNPMMSMMIKSPLKNFINTLAENLSKL
ncbi:SRPBCC family protein [Mesonia sp. HuA40]|uniref:SRPBCC family protein n=1 Tax=Mesonia sp. HuA40 TaxID=2602761 RepID=UPI0011C6F11F|nr:SRPBCC family protein [Mesonia sp. HuA40]TXK71190.1 SRPBCC family protein [Mesonia sp. HuA40]